LLLMPLEPLPLNTVRVRWLSTETAGDVQISHWRGMLDAEELARADRFHFAADRDTFIAAHALTRAMLSGATGRPVDSWHYSKGHFGKPALAADAEATGLCFNLSHTRGFVACAIARNEIGIDAEASERFVDFALLDRYFAPEEARAVTSASPERKAAVFFRLWTLKEAFIKATGEGLHRPLASFSFAFDPLRLSFHPECDAMRREDDPAMWQFFEVCPAPNRRLALAIRLAGLLSLQLDARAALSQEVAVRP